MPIPYKLVKRGKLNTQTGARQPLYPMVITNQTITPDEFLIRFAETINFSRTDVVYFIYALEKFISDQLKKGNIVQTGILGTFYTVLQGGAYGVNPEPAIRYRPSKEMKKEIKMAELVKAG